MPTNSDLVISLYRRDTSSAAAGYSIELRFTAAGSEKEKIATGTASLSVKDPEFIVHSADPVAYGDYLAGQLLAQASIGNFFDQALAAAQIQDRPLHIRLHIRPDAAELHNLRWETLRLTGSEPATGTVPAVTTLTGENVTFSRYLDSDDFRPVRSRSGGDIRALVAVADPTDTETGYGMTPVESMVELATAHDGLGDIASADLAARGQVTLDGIATRLRDGFDILYLVAHGKLVGGQPYVFLEEEGGTGKWVAGSELTTRIRELESRPRLAVLASCQSVGSGEGEPATQDNGALAGLGPQLAEAGVAAVIAMQGNFMMKTAAAFLPILFRELRRDGNIYRAMAVARGAVRTRPDWWMPVLFTSLRSGQVWEPLPPEARAQIARQPFEPETVYIPAWPFLMGSKAGEGIRESETPQHQVTIPAYRIGVYPVTVAHYAEFVKRTRADSPPDKKVWFLGKPIAKQNHPVTQVSWHEAVAYCRWLSKETGRRYRLPTEAEWEKAAAGTNACRYPWGTRGWRTRRRSRPQTQHPSAVIRPAPAHTAATTCWATSRNGQTRPGGAAKNKPTTFIRIARQTAARIRVPSRPRLSRCEYTAGVHTGTSARTYAAARRDASYPDSKVGWRGFRVVMEV